jgi:hypothetical protein
VFAPPSAIADAPPVQGAAAAGVGGGWLIASGVIQILLGAFWVVMGILVAAFAHSTEFLSALKVQEIPEGVTAVILVMFCGGGIATIVISSFVITRRKWAWIVSLVFDGLWGLYGVVQLVINPLGGVICLAVAISLILFLVAGRAALR